MRSEDPFIALTLSGRLNNKATRSATAKLVIKSLSGVKAARPFIKLKPRRIKFAIIPKKHASPRAMFCPTNPLRTALVSNAIKI